MSFAQKPDQGHPRHDRQVDRETGRRANGCKYGDARAQRLLNQFEARPPAQQHDVFVQRQPARHQAFTDQLVERIVAPHILG